MWCCGKVQRVVLTIFIIWHLWLVGFQKTSNTHRNWKLYFFNFWNPKWYTFVRMADMSHSCFTTKNSSTLLFSFAQVHRLVRNIENICSHDSNGVFMGGGTGLTKIERPILFCLSANFATCRYQKLPIYLFLFACQKIFAFLTTKVRYTTYIFIHGR